jgi:hypothetical protein
MQGGRWTVARPERSVLCLYCGATPGNKCMTEGNRVMHVSHSARYASWKKIKARMED